MGIISYGDIAQGFVLSGLCPDEIFYLDSRFNTLCSDIVFSVYSMYRDWPISSNGFKYLNLELQERFIINTYKIHKIPRVIAGLPVM